MATVNFNGKEYTMDELTAKMKELDALMGLKKEAKKAGVLVSAPKAAKERPAEINLLVANFAPVITSNEAIINGLFTGAFRGQDSISFNVTDQFAVIIRDRKITGEKAAKRKAEAEAKATEAKEKEELAALIAKCPVGLDEKESARMKELSDKYPEVDEKE